MQQFGQMNGFEGRNKARQANYTTFILKNSDRVDVVLRFALVMYPEATGAKAKAAAVCLNIEYTFYSAAGGPALSSNAVCSKCCSCCCCCWGGSDS